MQRLGQHFLKNKSALEKIAAALELADGDAVLEIGPGHGELTDILTQEKITVSVIEKDRTLIPALKEKFGGQEQIVEVVEGDALKILPTAVKEIKKRSGKKYYKLAGNIPYYITGKLLRVISELKEKPTRTVLLLQKEVAERICAAPPEMNRLAASVQFWAEPKIIGRVSKEDFSPPPKVDSAIILLATKSTISTKKAIAADRYYSAVRAVFAQPRKTILNNISSATPVNDAKRAKSEVAQLLVELSIIPENRPQDLSIEDITAIAKIFF